LPGATGIGFVFLGLVASFFYGFEGNYVAKYGTQGLDPVETLFLGLACWVRPWFCRWLFLAVNG